MEGINPPVKIINSPSSTDSNVNLQSENASDNKSDESRNNDDSVDAKGAPKPFQTNQGPRPVAKMSTPKLASIYKMNHKNRGKALIFSHKFFEKRLGLKERLGTDKDSDDLKNVLLDLKFDAKVHENKSFESIEKILRDAAEDDHTENDCILVCIMTHGGVNELYANDQPYKPERLWESFTADRCPTLAGKPKIFILQACRGDKVDSGVLMMHYDEVDSVSEEKFVIPIHADFVYGYACMPGYYSWRSSKNGSWYIQALVKELQEHGKTENFLSLLTFVGQRVAFDYESVSDDTDMDKKKQMPYLVSTLTRKLLLS